MDSNLPPDIVHNMLNSLSTKCLHKLKAVSRIWFSMIHENITRRSGNPRLVSRTLVSTEASSMLEIAILDCNWRVVDRFWEGVYHSYHHPNMPRNLHQSSIQFPTLCPVQACHGIVCLGMDDGHVILFNPVTEQMLQLPFFGARYQCIGLAYSGGQYKVILWFNDFFGQNCSSILTLGSNPWRDGWRTAVEPPFRVMFGRAPFVEGCIHILPDSSDSESHGSLDRIEPFHADTEAYRQSIRLPSSFYLRSKAPTARNLFEMNNCLSICITLVDCVEMWRLSDYDKINWVMDHHVRLSSLMPVPYRHHHVIMVDPVTVLQDGRIVMNVAMRDFAVQLVAYDTVKERITSLGQENSALASYTETIFDLREPEPGDPRFVWSPIVSSEEEESNSYACDDSMATCDLIEYHYLDPRATFSSAIRSDEESSNSFPNVDSIGSCDLVGCKYPDPTSSAARRQGLLFPSTGISVEARCSKDLLQYGYPLESCITISEKDGPEGEEGCMMSRQEEAQKQRERS